MLHLQKGLRPIVAELSSIYFENINISMEKTIRVTEMIPMTFYSIRLSFYRVSTDLKRLFEVFTELFLLF